jgi:hypothetical protein
VRAKKLEREFKDKLKKISTIEIIQKVFKISYKNNNINFKIPDVIFKKDNKYSIIEYKTDYGNIQQIKDYDKLFSIATKEKASLFWVSPGSWGVDELKKKYEPDGIQFFSEIDFLALFGFSSEKGLDAWMQ